MILLEESTSNWSTSGPPTTWQFDKDKNEASNKQTKKKLHEQFDISTTVLLGLKTEGRMINVGNTVFIIKSYKPGRYRWLQINKYHRYDSYLPATEENS